MKQQDYKAGITVSVTAKEAFHSINDVAAWWTICVEGNAQQLNDIFTVRFGETFITIKIIEFIPYQKISWQVIDGYKHWLKGNKREWQDTVMTWKIAATGTRTQINFTHIGLVPGIECYEGCENAWDFYIKEILFKLLTIGKGIPELK